MYVCVCIYDVYGYYTLYLYTYIHIYVIHTHIHTHIHTFVYACSVSSCPVFQVMLVMVKILELRLSGHFLSLGRRLSC